MTVNKRARCPLCGKPIGTYFDENHRRLYGRHYGNHRASILADPDQCEATGWLVEDDELIVTPRGPSPLKGIAQPPRSVCRRCLGEGLYEGDLCRACSGSGTRPIRPPAPTPPQQENSRP